jgi:predicted RNase H-like nuclease (RuvC/YqgF family)
VKWIIYLLVSTLPQLAQAEIYKCVNEKGNTTFSQRPCSETAEVVTVKPQKRSDPTPASREDYAAQLDAISTRTEIKKLEQEISKLRSKKRSLTRKMDAELAALRRKKQNAANNLAGATWEESISSEMQSVSKSYKTKIEATQDRIDDVNRELAQLHKDN